MRVTVVYKFATSTGCSWTVHARVLLSNRVLCVRRFYSLHTCGVAVRTYRNPRTGSELMSDVIANRVHNQPLTRPTDVVFDMKNDYGLDISYQVAWLGVEKARGIVWGSCYVIRPTQMVYIRLLLQLLILKIRPTRRGSYNS
ncbi:hypothetical protein ACSBR1_026668 [Camellia fascicularis]